MRRSTGSICPAGCSSPIVSPTATTRRPAGSSLGRALEEARYRAATGARRRVRSPEPAVDALWALLFTSGTSAAPKAVRCTQYRLLTTGNRMAMMLELTPDDVGYAAMPLFHTNSLDVRAGSGAGGRRLALPGPPLQRVGVPARRAPLRRRPGSTTPARCSPTCWRRRPVPTTPTTPCGSPSATKGHRRCRGGGGALRHADHRRLRVDRGRHRPGPHGEASAQLHRPPPPGDHGRRRRRARGARGPYSTPMAA